MLRVEPRATRQRRSSRSSLSGASPEKENLAQFFLNACYRNPG
jgi:hypothetical protein